MSPIGDTILLVVLAASVRACVCLSVCLHKNRQTTDWIDVLRLNMGYGQLVVNHIKAIKLDVCL